MVTTGDQIRISTASAVDLAGSEDNRRTENQKERMVESANINKSLFTLAKCVEAISRQDVRTPYRESKITRILDIAYSLECQTFFELQAMFEDLASLEIVFKFGIICLQVNTLIWKSI